ncbi:MAG: hypothetical protein ACD_45C00081G0001 [uncultured bacterium]|nr:MAG: hypothetical protein ACD_45C00081G0001 [uncultured bacterium]
MFTYLIQSKSSTEPSLILAIAIHKDTITTYMQPAPSRCPEKVRDLYPRPETMNHFDNCIDQYKTKVPLKIIKNADTGHDQLHYNLTVETKVNHQHYKHSKTITQETVESFLNHLKKCEAIRKLPKNNSFFSEEVQKDILQKFNKYLQSQNNKFFVASNNLDYVSRYQDNKNMLEMLCIAQPTFPGCNGVYNPIQLPTHNLTQSTNNFISQGIVGTLALGGLLVLGLFSRCCSRKKRNATVINQIQNRQLTL